MNMMKNEHMKNEERGKHCGVKGAAGNNSSMNNDVQMGNAKQAGTSSQAKASGGCNVRPSTGGCSTGGCKTK